jgi:hypothetical protein
VFGSLEEGINGYERIYLMLFYSLLTPKHFSKKNGRNTHSFNEIKMKYRFYPILKKDI